jgi:hypothetical protein
MTTENEKIPMITLSIHPWIPWNEIVKVVQDLGYNIPGLNTVTKEEMYALVNTLLDMKYHVMIIKHNDQYRLQIDTGRFHQR